MTDDGPPLWTPLHGAEHRVALEVLIHGPLPRSELARRLDLSAPSLTRLTRPLLESGLLTSADPAQHGSNGRPTQPLDINLDLHRFVGVKLTGDVAYGVVTTIRSSVAESLERPLIDHRPDAVAELVAELIDQLADGRDPVTAVGVAVGGKVLADGSVASSAYLDWTDVPFQRLLEERTGRQVVVANDLVAWTEAEHWFGAGRDVDSFALLTIGTGIGYGLVVHDRIVSSEDSGVGLAGHFPLDALGPRCPDGHRGCATAMLTIGSICSSVGVPLGRTVGYDECLDLAAQGHPIAGRVVHDAAAALGVLVAAIANLTQVDKIILSGDGVRLAVVGAQAMDEAIRANRSTWASDVDVVVDPSGFIDWARGAAVMAIQRYVLGDG
ncbi:ROK family protein [Xylanimonas sp. McL0601]|uniref:ROK family protein n=1 Tax=Xylanimonas sp. McL0601 TaxID=3414739 RepID=UPI003CF5E26D